MAAIEQVLGTLPRPHRLSIARKVGFTLGSYACNLYWMSVLIFLLFFYTDAVGLPAATAGLIYMIASIVDAVLDPVMGSIADRTRTRRGRYRPYILFGSVPLGLSFVLLYYKPPIAGLWLAIWLMVTHILFRFAYTALTIPYTSLNARLTDHSEERSALAGLSMVFGVLAALTVVYFTPPLIHALGHGNTARGYTWAAAVFAVVATAFFPLVYLSTQEPPEDQASSVRVDYRSYWRATFANKAFWVLILATCASLACSVTLSNSVLYYFKYYLQNEPAMRYALTAMSAAGLIVIPVWVGACKVLGKYRAWYAATIWGLVMLALFAAIELRSPILMSIWLVSWNISALGTGLIFWALLPDTVEYGEWVSGARTESFLFGLAQFAFKAALGIGAGLFGWLLSRVGYVANVAQAPATLASLKWLMIILPAVGLVVAAVLMIRFPMGRGRHEAIVAELAQRRRHSSA
jgi:GPH family glycoside/pentoside/hexuronide:cation symporter